MLEDGGNCLLALPGKPHIQLRSVNVVNNGIFMEEVTKDNNNDDHQGHIEPIVSYVVLDEDKDEKQKHKHLITSGADGRVVQWKVVANPKVEDSYTIEFVR